jgi:hypothetical protein
MNSRVARSRRLVSLVSRGTARTPEWRIPMNAGERQVIAEKIGSTVRVLELLGYHDYVVTAPKHQREKGNSSPRVVRVDIGRDAPLRIYNGMRGQTWANMPDGSPIPGIVTVYDIYHFLKGLRAKEKAKPRAKRSATKRPR